MAFLLPLVFPVLSGGEAGPVFVAAEKIWTGGGTLWRGFVRIEEGKIREVREEAEAPSDARVFSFPGAWVTSGLIDTHAYLGGRADLVEPTFSMTPRARALDVFEPGHRDFTAAVRSGITTTLLSPRDENLVGGLAAAVKTAGAGRIVREEALLKMSLGEAVLDPDREPTSRQGALALLRTALRRAAEEGPDAPLARLARGELVALVHTGRNDEVFAAGRFASEFGLKIALVHAPLSGEMAAFLKDRQIGVVCGPFDASTPLRALRTPGLLSEAGVAIAFCTDGPGHDPETLRLSAALAVRAGLPPDRALQALTSGAASLLGLVDRVGSIEPGRDADLVVWSGPPLDLASRVLAVFVDGEPVVDVRTESRRPRRPGDPIPAEASP